MSTRKKKETTMTDPSGGKGFALVCADDRTIQNVLQNSYELAVELDSGQPVSVMFDEACMVKVELFFEEAMSNGSAFDWELVIKLKEGPLAVHCALARHDGRFVLVGAGSRDSAIELIEEMLRINNEQTNNLRLAMKELHNATVALKQKDQYVYDELTRLNNQLSAMQRELVKKNHELKALDTQKNYFLGMAAHDLRSPLGTIVSYSELILDKPETSDDDRDLVGVIQRSAEFMLSLINDLLDVSKIESGNLVLQRLPLNLMDFVSRCISTNQLLARQKDIAIITHIESELPETVIWDGNRLVQVMNNLLGNAIKFSPPDSSIALFLMADITNITFRIDDSGEGLPHDMIDQLFIPFSRASRLGTRGEKGTGLGLAISRRIIEAHGGTIAAENIPGGGSRFIFSLPIGGSNEKN